jgi:hypothetical protein
LYNHPLIQGVSPLESRGKALLRRLPLVGGGNEAEPGTTTSRLAANQTSPNAPASSLPATDNPLPAAFTRTSRPSYIDPSSFALALLDLVAPAGTASNTVASVRNEINGLPNPRLRKSLLLLIDDSEADLKKTRANVEEWFNNSMDRVSGWYKRKVQLIILLIGLVVSLLLNADSITIVRVLWTQPAVREGLAQAAQTYVQEHKDTDLKVQRDTIEAELGLLRSTNLPFGWIVAEPDASKPMDPRNLVALWRNPAELLLKVLGLVVTGAAVSLGAPFWFETLGKVVKLRATGEPPKTDDTKED